MDAPIVLSHKTAWLYYQASGMGALNENRDIPALTPAQRTPRSFAKSIRKALTACGVDEDELEKLDILISFPSERTHSPAFRPHSHGAIIPASELISIAPGLLAVCPSLCFLQSSSWMSEYEQLEFAYELCGNYAGPQPNRSGYTVRPALSNVNQLREAAKARPSMKGIKQTRRVLRMAKDNSRSPMKTALAMMLAEDRARGGLGFKSFDLNKRVDIPLKYKKCSANGYFEIDLLAQTQRFAIEYDGQYHNEFLRRAHDAERLSVLRLMGYQTQAITAAQFSSQLSLNRSLNAICQTLGLSINSSAGFQKAQNELRKFVIRNWEAPEDDDANVEGASLMQDNSHAEASAS